MDFLNQYDRWLHDRVMNPTFRWIQKLFHWNRYQLILVSSAVCVAANVLISIVWAEKLVLHEPRTAPAVLVGIQCLDSIISLQRYHRLKLRGVLREASEQLEANKRVMLPTQVVLYAHGRKFGRGIASVLVTTLWFFLPFYVLLHGQETQLDNFSFLAVFIWGTSDLIERHLWDADDIEPRNRVNLFEPKTAQDNA